jgi:hypothetical protein
MQTLHDIAYLQRWLGSFNVQGLLLMSRYEYCFRPLAAPLPHTLRPLSLPVAHAAGKAAAPASRPQQGATNGELRFGWIS